MSAKALSHAKFFKTALVALVLAGTAPSAIACHGADGNEKPCAEGRCPYGGDWAKKLKLEGDKASKVKELQAQFRSETSALKAEHRAQMSSLKNDHKAALAQILTAEELAQLKGFSEAKEEFKPSVEGKHCDGKEKKSFVD